MTPLVLASASPRRSDLLQEHGFDFIIDPAEIEEIAPPHLTPGEIVLANARRKAICVAARHPGALVVGADTLVALEGSVLGKPRDMEEALNMLARLNGRTHHVFTGVWLARRATGESRGFIEVSAVKFRRLSARGLRDYAARVQPLDKAGAYAAQQTEPRIIKSITGSVSNVIGLPMEALGAELSRCESSARG